MTKHNKAKVGKDLTWVLLLALLVLVFGATVSLSYTIGPNYRNISVDTTVNITNAKPEVLGVTIDNGGDNITLNAGTTRLVTCNASVRDWNGGSTIANVTAMFFDDDYSDFDSADDNNDHYTNMSCSEEAVDGYYANYTCTFNVWYYANATTNWVCNVTATDTYDFNGTDYSSGWNTTEILSLYALNVTPLIDYGEMAVEDTSGAEQANITNFGNRPINISVYGYGQTMNDGLAMVCDIGNITIENEKFSLNETGDFVADYVALASSAQDVANLTIDREIIDGTQVENSTYWRLYVPPNPFGRCNGTIVFQAEASN